MFSLKEIGTMINRCMGKEKNKTEYPKRYKYSFHYLAKTVKHKCGA